MSIAMQKQTSRLLLLSPNQQAAFGGQLADAKLTYLASVDPSTAFSSSDSRYNDQGAAGHGTDFATVDIRTAWATMATMKGMNGVDAWLLGWMLAFIFGQEVVTGAAAPYTHTFTLPFVSALMPCTTAYAQDTDDVLRYFQDMAAKSLSIDIPERGAINATLDMVGTGRFTRAAYGGVLPALPTFTPLLGSDFQTTITPAGGAANLFAGRTRGNSIKIDRGSAQFQSSGDGLTAGSVQAGTTKFSNDFTIMADQTDDVQGWFENFQLFSVTHATNVARNLQLAVTYPNARLKSSKLSNVQDKVAWGLSLDEGTAIQVGSTPAISAQIINTCPGYLVAA